MESDNPNPRGYGRQRSDEPSTSSVEPGKRKTSESDDRNSDRAKRVAPERREARSKNKFISIIRTRPHTLKREAEYDPSQKVSAGVERIKLEVNYISQEKLLTEWNIHQYRVDIEPNTPLIGKRKFLVAQHKDTLRTYLFDGEQLFSNHRIHTEGDTLKLESMDIRDSQMYTIQLKFTNIVQPNHERCLQIYNLIFRNIESALKLQLVGRHYYDPAQMINIQQHRLQLWPGYETSIRQFTGGLLLNVDICHKVIRTDVVYDMMQEIFRKDKQNFKRNFLSQIIGQTVMTAYNNKTYRIDDVDFETKAGSTFKKSNKDVSFIEYYAEKYHVEIKDAEQPLLVVNPKERDRRGGQTGPVLLVPELCRFTGLDERQRNDIKIKNELKRYTQLNPRMRREQILRLTERVNTTNRCTEVLKEWDLDLGRRLVRANAFKVPSRELYFGNNYHKTFGAGWDDAFKNNTMLYETVSLRRFGVIYPKILQKEYEQFIRILRELSTKMGFNIKNIRERCVHSESNMHPEFERLANENAQLVLIVTSQDNRRNGDWYGGIKKKSAELGVPTQVVTKRILQSPGGRLLSITTKIAIQMNCKLGGLPWLPRIPMPKVMTVGFEIAKDSSNQKRYGCLVATMDLQVKPNDPNDDENSSNEANVKQRFFSKVEEINGPDCSFQLTSSMILALGQFEKEHKSLPDRIILYRGGVGEGDLPYVKEMEVSVLEKRLRLYYAERDQPLKLVYIVVTKKVNTRFFLANSDRHIEPGTVLDNTITLDERYEFFMVSQQITQGTATPTNYNVIYEEEEHALQPEKLQMWTWIQCHLYYNWCGTTRQPAVLQYATKLGFLVSNYMHRVPGDRMNNQLYFL